MRYLTTFACFSSKTMYLIYQDFLETVFLVLVEVTVEFMIITTFQTYICTASYWDYWTPRNRKVLDYSTWCIQQFLGEPIKTRVNPRDAGFTVFDKTVNVWYQLCSLFRKQNVYGWVGQIDWLFCWVEDGIELSELPVRLPKRTLQMNRILIVGNIGWKVESAVASLLIETCS